VATIVVALLSIAAIAWAQTLPPGGTFTDDDGNLHEGNIEAIAAASITQGCNPPTNDKYCPDSPVTRGAMAAFLVRALDLTDDGGGNLFTDDNGSIFESDIDKLGTAGVTKGCNPPTNDKYCPDSPVTRGAMAAFLVRALDLTDDGDGNLFTDDNGSVFESDIDKLGTAGVTKGCNPPTNDRFCPGSPVLRDQMASFLARALDLDPIVPPPTTTTTLPPGEFAPFEVTGKGDAVVAVSIPGDQTAVARIEYIGLNNFILWAVDGDFTFIDLLVNEINGYTGARPVNTKDILWDEPLRHLNVTSKGFWTVTFEPLSMARLLETSLSGDSDDVIRVSSAGTADFTYTGSTNFKVWARGEIGQAELLVNEVGDYVGTHIIPDWATYLDIIGIGDWTIELS